jgi:hypothetical protein
MSIQPFGSVEDDKLVNKTALDTGQTELIVTGEQFDNMSNTMVRRMAAKLDCDEVNGKSPRLITRSALVCQRSLTEYE